MARIAICAWDTRAMNTAISWDLAERARNWTVFSAYDISSEFEVKDGDIAKVFTDGDINALLHAAHTWTCDAMLILPSGTMVYDTHAMALGIKGLLASDADMTGHIIDHGAHKPERKTTHMLYGLHEQCLYLSKQVIADMIRDDVSLAPRHSYRDEQWPDIERSSENIHDAYTPLWIRAGSSSRHVVDKPDDGFTIWHGLVKWAINHGYTITNLPYGMRNCRLYAYHLQRSQPFQNYLDGNPEADTSQLHDGQIRFIKRLREASNDLSGFWAFNTEPKSIPRGIQSDCMVMVASGLMPMLIAARCAAEGAHIILIDRNQHCLEWQRWLFGNLQSMVDYKMAAAAFAADRDLNMLGSDDPRHGRDLAAAMDEIKAAWSILASCDVSYVVGDMIDMPDAVRRAISNSKRPFVWFSNVFRYMPTVDRGYHEEHLKAYLTDLLASNINTTWSGISTFYRQCKGPRCEPTVTDTPFYRELPDVVVPTAAAMAEIQALESAGMFAPHRMDDRAQDTLLHRGWSSFVLHGIGHGYTEGYERYGYSSDAEAPYHWTDEALRHCPKLVQWFKDQAFKDRYHRVRIMRLAPRGMVGMHNDNEHNDDIWATNMAINNPDGSEMHFWDREWRYLGQVPWADGKTFKIRIGMNHCVINRSDQPRYHMIVHGRGGKL